MSTVERRVLRIRVALNGRPLKSYRFSQPVVTVGRDPSCDIVLENTGISRQHLKFERGPAGFYSVIDLESANGSFLRGSPLKKDYLANDDVIQVAKFTLLINFESDQRNSASEMKPSPAAFSNTTVLCAEDLIAMEVRAREKSAAEASEKLLATPAPPVESSGVGRPTMALFRVAIIIAFLLGSAVGTWAHFLLSN